MGRFAIGYFDRLERRIVEIPFEALRFPAAAPRMFEIRDDEGELRCTPFHRVRRAYRDGPIV